MKILADENIALVHEAFAGFGDLQTIAGRDIRPEILHDVDALLVRSVTRVDSRLLEHSPCKFVGTATSGIDHIDTAWLEQKHIAFAQALGCNAASVVDYVFSACALLSKSDNKNWRDLGVGIIGCGEVGSRLAQRLLALGMRCKIYDPLLPATHPLSRYFTDLETVLQQDIVTVHTPLTRTGPWPTFHMLDAKRLKLLGENAILINAARGEVVDGKALLHRIEQYPGFRVVLDAWEGEPDISTELLHKVSLGTPHIAGYSSQGKLNGTAIILQAFCKNFALPAPQHLFAVRPEPLSVPTVTGNHWQLLNELILSAYDVGRDHQCMQTLMAVSNTRENFDSLRRTYPERKQFNQYRVVANNYPDTVLADLKALGFLLAG